MIPWTIVHQAPLSMGFFRQEYWSELTFLSPGDLPDPGIEPMSPVSPALAGEFSRLSHQGNQAKNEKQCDITIAAAHYYFKALKKSKYRSNTNFTVELWCLFAMRVVFVLSHFSHV